MEQEQPFQNAVPHDHPYRQLLTQAINRLPNIFQIKEGDHPWGMEATFPLKMHCRQNQDAKYATFIYTFTFPISSQQYLKIATNLELQKQVDNYTDQFKIFKDLNQPDTEYLYLAYKKVMIVNPRYFIYLRYTFKANGDVWMVAISDPQAQVIKDKTRGEIVLTAIRIKQVQGGSLISVFSETDMKMNLKFQTSKSKGFFQIKKYLQKLYATLPKP